jgi:hypothetical protein
MRKRDMRRTLLVLGCLWLMLVGGMVSAQRSEFRAQVQFESVYVRALPSPDAEPVASVFQDNLLDVIGRNLDGTWFEVRRPGRMSNLGWILAKMVSYDFSPELLPMTDFTTGQTGQTALSADPGFAAYIIDNVSMRSRPSVRTGERVGVIPLDSVVPIVARNQDASWLYVNYLGDEGWISGYNARSTGDTSLIPEAPNLDPLEVIAVTIIPPEVQLAQLNQLRAYVTASRDLALALQGFWAQVYQGQIMPCEQPAFVQAYQYTSQDVQQLPELKRYVPRLETAIEALNGAIEPLTICGLFDPNVLLRARNDAINAQVIFSANLDVLDNLAKTIR